jgi:DNA-binding transcriptional LysR family regulator
MADRRLQVFHAVARHLSFTRAAEALFMTQPAVTFQVKQLEQQLDVRLFERGHGRISLTPAGRLVLEYAERILTLTTELETRVRELTGDIAGPLLVGASTTIAEFLLPRVLGAFTAAHPGVQPRLVVGNSETVEAQVAEHALDLGLIEGPPREGLLIAEPCGEDELQVIVAPGHALAALDRVRPDQLAGHPLVSRESGSGTREFTDRYLRAAGLDPDSLERVMELGSPETIKGVVQAGTGFAIMSRAAAEKDCRLGLLKSLPLEPRLVRSLSVVYPRERFRSRLVTTFVEFVRARLAP